jgi:hypothetical protein
MNTKGRTFGQSIMVINTWVKIGEQVGWCRNGGYLVKVVYNDGYTEMVHLKKLI